jgi:predicted RecB family nuclease
MSEGGVMQLLDDDSLILSASDLASHLACAHLVQQKLAVVQDRRGSLPVGADPHATLIQARGEAHEAEQLEKLRADAERFVVDLSALPPATDRAALETGAAATREAMQAGADLIYQAPLFDGRRQGRVDFLRRIPGESAFGDFAYEILDTKLARQVKPHFVHQLCFYTELLAAVQGTTPKYAHVILGDGFSVPIELRRYAALHRHLVTQLEEVVLSPPRETYPEPVAHCDICDLFAECRQRLVDDDHLSLVATARRENREDLVRNGIPTVVALADATPGDGSTPLGAERFEYLRRQAGLQVESRTTGEPTHLNLKPVAASGYALLPEPSPGDVYFDLEGDPYIGDKGIEYLWGWWTADGYEHRWAHDAASEKLALEQFVDRVTELRAVHPGMHIFHYAPHERAKLRSLATTYATREVEVDDLLRGEVLVDLFAVVRQGLQVGEEKYSLKALERQHDFVRLEHGVREGGGSIVVYEQWLQTGEAELLESICAYNEEDCSSTESLRAWLERAMRPEAEAEFKVKFSELVPEEKEDRGPPPWMDEVLALIGRLAEPRPGDAADPAAPADRELLGNLLLYHYRESKPDWWRYFDLRGKPVMDLVEDRDAVGELTRIEDILPTEWKQSLDYTFTFPAQETRLKPGDAEDPITGEKCTVVSVTTDRIVLRRSKKKPPPEPVALVSGSPINTGVFREALIELAERVLDDDQSAFTATRDLLRGAPPRSSAALDEDPQGLVETVLGLDRSILPVQGPPGTGKTYRAARVVVGALAAGKRVGITAQSHAAIQNVLHAVEAFAHDEGESFSAIYKRGEGGGYESSHGMVEIAKDNKDVTEEFQLVAGTAWLFARPEHRRAFDLLLIDEAGQFSLASAVAVGLAAENMVLLGDPQQLPQVTQADHPVGSGVSVLEHLLDGEQTIAADRGMLLSTSWRMHPAICAFVSERSYEERLGSLPDCALCRVDAPGSINGAGLRTMAIEHEGRSQSSPEEAGAIAAACAELLAGSTVTDRHGRERTLAPKDILVVAPYNLAVREIQTLVPAGIQVGTVDRFQGKEAPVVFYAMTCSAGEDVPRGMDFLFDAHRFNVAVSRAQCLAVLVHSPRLLDADCPTLRVMELVDGVCRFVELAEPIA